MENWEMEKCNEAWRRLEDDTAKTWGEVMREGQKHSNDKNFGSQRKKSLFWENFRIFMIIKTEINCKLKKCVFVLYIMNGAEPCSENKGKVHIIHKIPADSVIWWKTQNKYIKLCGPVMEEIFCELHCQFCKLVRPSNHWNSLSAYIYHQTLIAMLWVSSPKLDVGEIRNKYS